jgi:hypothetical protein
VLRSHFLPLREFQYLNANIALYSRCNYIYHINHTLAALDSQNINCWLNEEQKVVFGSNYEFGQNSRFCIGRNGGQNLSWKSHFWCPLYVENRLDQMLI